MSVPTRVTVLLLEPVVAYDAVIAPQVLGCATGADGRELYEVRLASLTGAPAQTTDGYAIVPHGDQRLLDDAHLVVVPGTHHREIRYAGRLTDDARGALARIPADSRVASICTGAFALAAAGMLDGLPATTHWAACELFGRLHPRVELRAERLYVDNGRICTSAGLSAGVDLCLHLIRAQHGSEVANRAARQMVTPAWRDGGQAQFIESPVPQAPGTQALGASTAAAQAWALENLSEPLAINDLAAVARQSLRTFNRRFRAETGTTPRAWLTQQRVRLAQELLETTDLGVDDIALRAGLGSGTTLRSHLRAASAVTPSAYRSAFRGYFGANVV